MMTCAYLTKQTASNQRESLTKRFKVSEIYFLHGQYCFDYWGRTTFEYKTLRSAEDQVHKWKTDGARVSVPQRTEDDTWVFEVNIPIEQAEHRAVLEMITSRLHLMQNSLAHEDCQHSLELCPSDNADLSDLYDVILNAARVARNIV